MALLVALALASSCRVPRPAGVGPGRASDFSLRDIEGRTVRLSDYLGTQVVLLSFWATWCAPCAGEMPHLQRLYEAHEDEGLVVLGIAMDGPESVANVAPQAQRYGLTFPILLDEETRVVGTYNPKRSAPYSVLIDRDGTIARAREGYSAGDEIELEREIRALLETRSDQTTHAAGLLGDGTVPPDTGVELTLGMRKARVALTSTTSIGWHGDNQDASSENDDYGELFERLNVTAGTGPWVAGLRLDTASFVSEPSSELEDRYTLEKAWIGWTGRALEVTAGDAYVSFGRGLALSLRKVDELGMDTTVRGMKLLVHEGNLGGTVVVGYANIQNLDEASGRSLDDPYDLIGGLQAQVALGRVTASAHGSAVAFREPVGLVPGEAFRDRYYQLGLTLDAPRLTEHVGLYLEGVSQLRDTEPAADEDTGSGLYGAATAYLGRATILVEGKAYGALEPIKPRLARPEFSSLAYNSPPTLERVLQVIENPQQDIAGGRVRMDWSFSSSLLVHGNYGLFRDQLGYADPDQVGMRRPGTIHDPYVGIEARWNQARSRALASVGWRAVFLAGTGAYVRGDAHVEADVVQALGHHWSVNLHGVHIERKKHASPLLDEQLREGTLLLGVRYRSMLTVSGGYDYTTEPSQPKRDYISGNAQWDITPSSSLRLFAGAARGGLKCVSGVCRAFPPFQGIKLVATLRY